MIKLIDLIKLAGVELGHFKIHCATGWNPTPLEAFYAGEFKNWQEYQGKRNFECESVLSLIQMGRDKWLFAGLFKVDGVQKKSNEKKSWYEYAMTEIPGLEHLAGRAIVLFKREFRASYLMGSRYGQLLLVSEIKSERVSVRDFPGYHGVCITYHVLRTILRQDIPSWRTALSNVAGIYLIADTLTGKQYIGSAYGGSGLWQRWCAYADNGHGGNKELKEIITEKGPDYARNFQFTILEVIDLNASPEYVLSRESYWKDILLTRKFGYNSN